MNTAQEMGVRRFGRVNWLGTYTLARREVMRFLNVWSQTIMAPLINAGLFLLIFTIAIGKGRGDVMGVPFMHFLAPGILTMTVIQNAFANTSSSITSAKVQGNIVDTLMPPLSPLELVLGYIAGAVARGMIVAVVIAFGAWIFLGVGIAHPLWTLAFVLAGSVFMGALGIVAAIFAESIRELRRLAPGTGIEVLIPDFDGKDEPLRLVMEASPDILDHNLETVERLQKPVRKRARYVKFGGSWIYPMGEDHVSIGFVVGPLAAGWLYQQQESWASVFSAGVFALLLIIMLFNPEKS